MSYIQSNTLISGTKSTELHRDPPKYPIIRKATSKILPPSDFDSSYSVALSLHLKKYPPKRSTYLFRGWWSVKALIEGVPISSTVTAASKRSGLDLSLFNSRGSRGRSKGGDFSVLPRMPVSCQGLDSSKVLRSTHSILLASRRHSTL